VAKEANRSRIAMKLGHVRQSERQLETTMTQETLYLDLAKHFERRAPVRATDDIDRHADSAFASYLEALITYAQFAVPVLVYMGTHVADHIIDRVTDGAVDKDTDAARAFGKKFIERFYKEVRQPTLNFDPKEFENIASQADEFGVVLIRRASVLKDDDLDKGIATGQAAAHEFLKSQLNFSDDEARHVTGLMVVDIHKAIERTRDKEA
jgi:hypothetical protein